MSVSGRQQRKPLDSNVSRRNKATHLSSLFLLRSVLLVTPSPPRRPAPETQGAGECQYLRGPQGRCQGLRLLPEVSLPAPEHKAPLHTGSQACDHAGAPSPGVGWAVALSSRQHMRMGSLLFF